MLLILCALTSATVFVQPETGCAVPTDFTGQGYSELIEPVTPGVGEWTGSGPWGGNLRGLAASESDNSIVIAGCGFSMAPDAGGVWRSTDGGITWSVTELAPVQVNDVCSGGPAAPNTFYAATRQGLHVSTDNGITWNPVSGMTSSYVVGIGVSCSDPDLLIAGLSSSTGIRRSTDGGATWETVGINSGYMKGFGCDTDHPDTMYVAMFGLSSSLYKSSDGGASWTPTGPSTSGWGLLVAPFGLGNTIIISTSDGYYMSTDCGVSWSLVVSGVSYAPAVCDGTNLYAPVINAGGVYESTDQGVTWTLNTQGIVESFWQAGCASSAGFLVGHWGGIYRSETLGDDYVVSQYGIGNSFVYTLSYTASTGTLLAGGDGHGLWKSTDDGLNWNMIIPGPADWSIRNIAPKNDDDYSGPVRYVATGAGLYRSDDAGENWVSAGFSGTQVSCVTFDPSDPDRAWAGISIGGIYYTTDGGGIWTLGTGSSAGFYPAIELIELTTGEFRILVAFQVNGDGVYYSDDGGVSYTLAPVPGSYLPDLALSPHTGVSGPTAFLATGSGIYRSYDYGESWNVCPGSSGHFWAVQGSLCDNVFGGTNGTGVRWSPDDGDSWQLLNNGIANRVVWDIVQGQDQAQLFAGLRGFGVVELTDPELGIETGDYAGSSMTLTVSPNPASSSVNFVTEGFTEGTALISVYSSAGRLVHRETITAGIDHRWSPGAEVPTGIYLVRASCGERTADSKLVLVK